MRNLKKMSDLIEYWESLGGFEVVNKGVYLIVCLEIGFGLLLELYWISGWKIIWTKRRKWWNWIIDNSIWNSLIDQYVGHYLILTSTNTKISKMNKNLLKVPPRTLFLIKPIFFHNIPTQIHIAILSTTKNTNTS